MAADLIERLTDIAYYIRSDVIGGNEPADDVEEAIAEIKRLRSLCAAQDFAFKAIQERRERRANRDYVKA